MNKARAVFRAASMLLLRARRRCSPCPWWTGSRSRVPSPSRVSGALLAARHRLDIIGFLFVANMTGVGGGTVRDLLLDAPVFWVQDATHIAVCSAAALLTYAAASLLDRASQALLWADAVGVALFAVLGAQKALLAGVRPEVAVMMGVFTACFGGIIRDVTLNDTPIIMRREIYISATLAGALVTCCSPLAARSDNGPSSAASRSVSRCARWRSRPGWRFPRIAALRRQMMAAASNQAAMPRRGAPFSALPAGGAVVPRLR